MIEVDVLNDLGEWHQWWYKFREYYVQQGVDMENEVEITRTLAEWNAIDEDPESTVFYFENEHDHLVFMLRFA